MLQELIILLKNQEIMLSLFFFQSGKSLKLDQF